jgi:peptide/nickel transport system permease protein
MSPSIRYEYQRGRGWFIVTDKRKEKVRLLAKNLKKTWKQFRTNMLGMVGLTILLVFVLMALLAPWLARYDNPNSMSWAEVNPRFNPPSGDFLFGTDYFGRDVYTLTMYGAQAALIVGLAASAISMGLGTAIGVSAGFFGRVSDEILMRFTDFFLVIPWFPLMIVVATLMGQSFTNVILVIGITSWPSTARIVRAQVLTVKERAFIERSKSVGAGGLWVIRKHILPNIFPLIFANTILLIANSIFSESFLDFFGLGDPNVISWGVMLEEAYSYGAFSAFAWWNVMAPGASIVVLIMGFYLVGDALDEVMNPKLRKR